MAPIMGQRQTGNRGRRKVKNKFNESLRWLKMIYCRSPLIFFLPLVLPGAACLTVAGQKGGNITLPCTLSYREDLSILLTSGPITVYGPYQNEHFRGRVHKSGSCDLILQDLKAAEAGKYISRIYANDQLLDSYTYDVHVNVDLTGQKGRELMFDDLPREAESIKHYINADWKEVWRRGQGVLTDRLIVKNGRLTIENFTSSDAETYRVLNSTGGILVTVTVTESDIMKISKEERSASSMAGVSWSAALPFLIYLFISFL